MQPQDVEAVRERLTWEQICRRHPNEWVVLIDMEWENGDEDDGELVSAIVLAHSMNRGDCLRESKGGAGEVDFLHFAHLYTGPVVPEGFVSLRFAL